MLKALARPALGVARRAAVPMASQRVCAGGSEATSLAMRLRYEAPVPSGVQCALGSGVVRGLSVTRSRAFTPTPAPPATRSAAHMATSTRVAPWYCEHGTVDNRVAVLCEELLERETRKLRARLAKVSPDGNVPATEAVIGYLSKPLAPPELAFASASARARAVSRFLGAPIASLSMLSLSPLSFCKVAAVTGATSPAAAAGGGKVGGAGGSGEGGLELRLGRASTKAVTEQLARELGRRGVRVVIRVAGGGAAGKAGASAQSLDADGLTELEEALAGEVRYGDAASIVDVLRLRHPGDTRARAQRESEEGEVGAPRRLSGVSLVRNASKAARREARRQRLESHARPGAGSEDEPDADGEA